MAITKTDVYDVQAPFLLDTRNSKADLPARDAIGAFSRAQGLLCYTVSENVLWLLAGGTSNTDWKQVWPAVASTGLQSVVVNAGSPTGGADGDIWLQQVGVVLTVHQRVSGSWTSVGTIRTGPTYTLDPSVPTSGTLAYLNSTYPSAKVGDIVALELSTQLREWTCYLVDANPVNNKWARIDKAKQT